MATLPDRKTDYYDSVFTERATKDDIIMLLTLYERQKCFAHCVVFKTQTLTDTRLCRNILTLFS